MSWSKSRSRLFRSQKFQSNNLKGRYSEKLRVYLKEVVMFTLFLVCRVLTIEVVEYSLSCRVLTLAYFSKLVEYSLQGEYSSSDDSVLL